MAVFPGYDIFSPRKWKDREETDRARGMTPSHVIQNEEDHLYLDGIGRFGFVEMRPDGSKKKQLTRSIGL